MTVPPETYYARSDDIRIAHQVTGKGHMDILWAPGATSHLDLVWEWPPYARFIEELGAFCRLIRFDKRGTGLSDRPAALATLEQRIDDIRAVMDAVDSKQATIFGVSEGGSMACLFAAMYPGRTRSLVLYGTQARWVRTDDYPWGPTRSEYDQWVERIRETWPSREYLSAAEGRHVDPAFLEWWARYKRAAASPSSVAALEAMNGEIDIRAVLPTIRVPTLVLHRTGDPVAHVEAGRDLAATIPGARFVELPGDQHWFFGVEQRILDEIEEFVTGMRSTIHTDRFLTTVCFVDIVGSSERAVALGDTGWRDLLGAYYALVRREVARFRGEEQDTAGDGFFATFDGPARAVRCAITIREVVRRLGIQVRAGVHTGECERMGESVGGIAVHIGARVGALAVAEEILVSQTVKDLVAGAGLDFAARGAHTLKGVPGDWLLFAVTSA